MIANNKIIKQVREQSVTSLRGRWQTSAILGRMVSEQVRAVSLNEGARHRKTLGTMVPCKGKRTKTLRRKKLGWF